MKSNRFSSILRSAMLSSAFAVSLLATARSAFAQGTPNPDMRANIPFSFVVGSKEGEDFALGDVEADVLDGSDIAEGFDQIGDGNHLGMGLLLASRCKQY